MSETSATSSAAKRKKRSKASPQLRRNSTAAAVRSRVLRSTNRYWEVDDFSGSPDAVSSELRRLVQQEELDHVRRGVYWRGSKSRFGMSIPRHGTALRRVVGEKEAIGAAEWYATNLLGLSTQVSPVEVLALSRRPPEGFKNVRIVDRTTRTGRRDQNLNDIEVTLFEALEGWDRYIELGPEEALDRFQDLLNRDDIRVDRLVRASRTESPAVRERLRAVLEESGYENEAAKVLRARSRSARQRALRVLGRPAD